jgi:uncharacterized phosphosugar-binding protein
MVPVKYLAAVRDLVEKLEQTQLEAVEQAADLIVASLTHGGAVFCSEIGHGNQGDFINRAGGLLAVQPFSFNVTIHSPVPECLAERPRQAPFDTESETVRLALRAGNVRPGDTLLISSVSGRNRRPVELALACREMGIHTIGFTSMEYTGTVASLHPSGKRLFEVVDVVLDNCAPYGDAAVEIPGYDFKLLPVSGVAMIIAGWMIWGRVMEKMAAAGNPPSVLMSINREGGQAYYDKTKAEYNKRGY